MRKSKRKRLSVSWRLSLKLHPPLLNSTERLMKKEKPAAWWILECDYKKTKRISRKSYKEYSKKGRKIMTNARKLESWGLQKSRITEFFAISLDSILNMPLSLNSRHGGFELLQDRKKGRKKRKKGGNKKIREQEVMDEKIQE